MAQVTAQWRKIGEAQSLQRSSQVIAIAEGQAYVFGGELEPRKPRDNDVHCFSVHEKGKADSFHVSTSSSKHNAPSPRVGSAVTTLNGNIYIFSGRGGVAMAPIDESGGVWKYTVSSSEWNLLSPSDNSSAEATPEPRSFHCLASNGHDTLYLHAGCPEKGRLSDLWAFQVSDKTWTKLRSAPDPGRGGTSIAFAGGLLYRMNGFDGKNELGGALDIYDPAEDSWTSHAWVADGRSGPGPRSVATLLPVQIGGKGFLLTMFGERDPSALGHEGAGKMLDDVWAFDLVGKQWHLVECRRDPGLSREGDRPVARGWFAADSLGTAALVQGGVGETNARLGDAWLLVLD